MRPSRSPEALPPQAYARTHRCLDPTCTRSVHLEALDLHEGSSPKSPKSPLRPTLVKAENAAVLPRENQPPSDSTLTHASDFPTVAPSAADHTVMRGAQTAGAKRQTRGWHRRNSSEPFIANHMRLPGSSELGGEADDALAELGGGWQQ